MAAPTSYYCDPAINANSGTGTIGDPFGDLQYALNTITRDATNGDQINIKAGTAEVLAAALTLATYGAPAETAPLILRGYTSAAGDGGIAEIDCNGYKFWTATNYVAWVLADLTIHNFGNNHGIDGSGASSPRQLIYHCNIHKGASTPSGKGLINMGQNPACQIIGCYIHDAGTNGFGIIGSGLIIYNYIYNCPYGMDSTYGVVANNIIHNCTTYAIGDIALDGHAVFGNTIYSSTAATGTAIHSGTNILVGPIINNVIEGYSGTGGKGIASTTYTFMVGYNSIYNCATPTSLGDVYLDLTANDVALTASPFTNSGGGDFSLKSSVTGALENAFPGAWYGPASTTNKAERGAVQKGAGTGGAVTISPSRGGGL